jgi:hypothetical protein
MIFWYLGFWPYERTAATLRSDNLLDNNLKCVQRVFDSSVQLVVLGCRTPVIVQHSKQDVRSSLKGF